MGEWRKYYSKEAFKTARSRFTRSRWTASKRSLAWTITFEEYKALIQDGVCFYCHRVMSGQTGTGLDRRDNALGYLLSNVVACCWECNMIKGELTEEEATAAVTAVIKVRKDGGKFSDVVPPRLSSLGPRGRSSKRPSSSA